MSLVSILSSPRKRDVVPVPVPVVVVLPIIVKAMCVLLLMLTVVPTVIAHVRWQCPKPRSPDTGIKEGPCGAQSNNLMTYTNQDILEIAPGWMRVSMEESIFHTGAPFRIALSRDGTDDTPCVLLDHIPHNDNVATYPSISDPSTYKEYAIAILIPDVLCERCSLHLVNPMTDKIGDAGAPNGIGCTDPNGTCFSVYHSCTLPFKINGTIPREQYQCPKVMPDDWPTQWIGDNGQVVDASVQGVYRREASLWKDGLLMTVPDRYRQNTGVCRSGTNQNPLPSPVQTPVQKQPTTPEPDRTSLPTPTPTSAAATTSVPICFAGHATVQIENGTTIAMRNLRVGDKIRVGRDKFEAVYAFAKRNEDISAQYLRLIWKKSRESLDVSATHMIWSNGRMIPASQVRIGDFIWVNDRVAFVSRIKNITHVGAYAPLTFSGRIVVNGVLASTYVSYQSTEYLVLGNTTHIEWNAHDLAHAFMTPIRLLGLFSLFCRKDLFFWLPAFFGRLEKIIHVVFGLPAVVTLPVVLPALAVIGCMSLLENYWFYLKTDAKMQNFVVTCIVTTALYFCRPRSILIRTRRLSVPTREL